MGSELLILLTLSLSVAVYADTWDEVKDCVPTGFVSPVMCLANTPPVICILPKFCFIEGGENSVVPGLPAQFKCKELPTECWEEQAKKGEEDKKGKENKDGDKDKNSNNNNNGNSNSNNNGNSNSQSSRSSNGNSGRNRFKSGVSTGFDRNGRIIPAGASANGNVQG